jgi:hypothetical protein
MSEQKIGNAIRFEQDPSKFSALLAYMAGTVDDPKWDMCIYLSKKAEGRYALWGFREQAIARNIIAADVQSFSLSIAVIYLPRKQLNPFANRNNRHKFWENENTYFGYVLWY